MLDPDSILVSRDKPETREGPHWVIRPGSCVTGIRVQRVDRDPDMDSCEPWEKAWMDRWMKMELLSRVTPRPAGTTAADIAEHVELRDPQWYWERTGQGRTIWMLLNVVAALADGWQCTIAAPEFTEAARLQDRVRHLAERAGVEILEGQLTPLPEAAAYDLANAGHFEPETKRALFTDHWKPEGKMATPASWKPEAIHGNTVGPPGHPYSGQMLDEDDAQVKALRADQARPDGAAPPQLHRATRRTRVVESAVFALREDGGSDVSYRSETIHEVLADERNDRRVQARWVRVPAPQPTT